MAVIVRQRRDTTANWNSNNPVIPSGQICYDTENNMMKIGDGASNYLDLPNIGDIINTNNLEATIKEDLAKVTTDSTSFSYKINNDLVDSNYLSKFIELSNTQSFVDGIGAGTNSFNNILATDAVMSDCFSETNTRAVPLFSYFSSNIGSSDVLNRIDTAIIDGLLTTVEYSLVDDVGGGVTSDIPNTPNNKIGYISSEVGIYTVPDVTIKVLKDSAEIYSRSLVQSESSSYNINNSPLVIIDDGIITLNVIDNGGSNAGNMKYKEVV